MKSTQINGLSPDARIAFNPPVTARVKISQNVDILAKVYLVHLKVEHCQTLQVKMSEPFLTRKSIVWYFFRVAKMTVKKKPVKNSQLTDFDHYRYLPLT